MIIILLETNYRENTHKWASVLFAYDLWIFLFPDSVTMVGPYFKYILYEAKSTMLFWILYLFFFFMWIPGSQHKKKGAAFSHAETHISEGILKSSKSWCMDSFSLSLVDDGLTVLPFCFPEELWGFLCFEWNRKSVDVWFISALVCCFGSSYYELKNSAILSISATSL